MFLSCAAKQGKPRQIFEHVLNKEFELLVSEKQLPEIKRVINYPRLKFTGDKHLLKLKEVQGINIIRPAEFINLL